MSSRLTGRQTRVASQVNLFPGMSRPEINFVTRLYVTTMRFRKRIA